MLVYVCVFCVCLGIFAIYDLFRVFLGSAEPLRLIIGPSGLTWASLGFHRLPWALLAVNTGVVGEDDNGDDEGDADDEGDKNNCKQGSHMFLCCPEPGC